LDLRGKVAIVTGASGGIGSATVRAFASRGIHLVLAAPSSEFHRLDELAAETRQRGVRAIVVPTDVTHRADVDRLVDCTLKEFDAVDVLANIAGIGSSPALCDDSDDELERVVTINLLGCARTMHAVLPVMKAQRRGTIVNIGSVAGEAGILGIYSASKFGLRGLSDSVRREVRSYNVSVTLIEPGLIRSQLNPEMGENLPSPDIVARAIVRAIERPRRRVIVPAYYSIPVFITNAFPGLTDLVFGDERIQQRLNRDARATRAKRKAEETPA
jgi:NAD(P)-dependent dehydrogenase (short-subunit alcohol dehydrogenase family)